MRQLMEKILQETKKATTKTPFEDLYYMGLEAYENGENTLATEYLKKLDNACKVGIFTLSDKVATELYDLNRNVLKALAPHDFESYITFIEWERDPTKKFYMPRRKGLKSIVKDMQALMDDELDLLAISLPPGTGKTTLAIFFLTWIAGKYPDEPILTGSHSNAIVRGMYDECLRIMDINGEYLWKEVFPHIPIVSTNAKGCRIDLMKSKRFETLEFTSIGSGNAGLYRCSRLLYCDDLVSSIEEALNEDRLKKLWESYTVDLRQRKIGDHCKELHIATRWSVRDVIGRLETQYAGNDRCKFVAYPAMNEDDESNFDYQFGCGFSTEFYRQQRDIMDTLSWNALYMNRPMEREGILFEEGDLMRYDFLPEGEPDAIFSACDTKDKGADYCVMPIAYLYSDGYYYIEDIVCDNGNIETIIEKLVAKLMEHKVKRSRFESNSAGGQIAQRVKEKLLDRGGFTEIETRWTTSNKETKIIVNSPFVKAKCKFKSKETASKEYKRAISMLCSYNTQGKNKHDDVPDAFAQLAIFADTFASPQIEIWDRPC